MSELKNIETKKDTIDRISFIQSGPIKHQSFCNWCVEINRVSLEIGEVLKTWVTWELDISLIRTLFLNFSEF